MEETVSCRICGHIAKAIVSHLKTAHGITSKEYREQYPDARIRSEATEAKRRRAVSRAYHKNPRKGRKKTIRCSSCGTPREVALTFAPAMHETRCPVCLEAEKWASLVEGEDYVSCAGCGHRAENLTSHIRKVHPEWVGCYPGQVVAYKSSIRDKSALKGRRISDDARNKMSVNAGKWNKGLTKDTDSRVATQAKHRTGHPSWSKGLTKETHPSLRATSEKLSAYTGQRRYWTSRADLSVVDFTPYLDETGAVDRKAMSEALGLCEPTITKYMRGLGLRLSTKYVDARAERATVRLDKADLEQYALQNGRVVIGRAMVGLGYDFSVIKRECERHGLKTFNRRIRQTLCLNAVSEALGGASYRQEWSHKRFYNPVTGRRFRFDGYFPDFNLVVEFHGYQHWVFPSVYIKDRGVFEALQERDRQKAYMVKSDPVLRYFEVREDELYADSEYLKGRLVGEGIFGR